MKCICEIQLIYSNIRRIIIPINKSMMYWKIKHKYIKIAYIYIHTHTWIGEGNATHFSILAWEVPWTEEPGKLQSMRSQKSHT